MKTLKEKSYRVMSGTKTYRLLEVESSDKGFSADTKYLVESSNGSLTGGFGDNLKKAEKYFEDISSVLNWL
jgi:hypothetical protein